MLTAKIGLEFEYILSTLKNNIVFPGDYNLGTDEFLVLGESRTDAHTNVPDLLGDFYKKWFLLQQKLQENKLKWETAGFSQISPEFYASILRRMGTKELSTCGNIYRSNDILKMTDAQVKDGKIISYYITSGLHLHFSLMVERKVRRDLLLHVKGDTYKRTGETYDSYKDNVLPKEWMNKIIRFYDKVWLPFLTKHYPTLKFRQPGFFEIKSWGFEYRSLPFSFMAMENLPVILNDGFKLLNQIKFI